MPLTKEQADSYTKFFKATDSDGNGYLTIHELRDVLQKKLKMKVSDKEVIEMFKGVDQNNDNKITLDEFLNEMGKINPKDLQRADLERAFEMIDQDKNRTLDAGELKKLFVTCGHKVSDDHIQSIIKQLDKDGDGQINFDEFLKLF
ncbi:hypothetical protein SNE40_023432 [Patella caerulea]|uniref:EF-hand domain-containing protein n=1 Tax=Patella caerulea TaxID=87958 RepID=A0AAN8IWZ9_PATCE